jgi:hypothetical protein
MHTLLIMDFKKKKKKKKDVELHQKVCYSYIPAPLLPFPYWCWRAEHGHTKTMDLIGY